MTDTKIKHLNQPGDYYFCSICADWHRLTNDPSSTGNQHLSHLDENETNSPTSKYFFCSLCGKWHTDARKDHLQYRLYIQQDHNLNPMPSILPPNMLSSKPSKNPATAILGPFDGTADLWMTESENLSRIRSAVARDHCKRIIDLIKGLDKNLHIQCFSKKNHLTFIMQGKNFAEIKPISDGFALSLKPNILNQGKRSVHKGEEEKFIFTGNGNPPISDVDIDNLKFLIVAPDVDFKNSSLNMDIVENIKSLGCKVEALHLNDNWKETEDVYVVKTDKL